MSKFILVDHSLQSLSGHHFEYALHALTAAERAGYEPWLVTNAAFELAPELPVQWSLRRVYRHTRYFNLSFDCQRDAAPKKRRFGWFGNRLGKWREDRRRAERARIFADETAKVFAEMTLAAGDQIVFPTLTEIDLNGLAQFLAAHPDAKVADWHVQFHLPIYWGCEPDYPSEDASLEGLRRAYRRATTLAATPNLHLYTTTETLAIQYNRLGIGAFHALPYPHNPDLESARKDGLRSGASSALKVAFLGGARSEKGYQHLSGILGHVWAEHVERGRARFIIHSTFEPPGPTAEVVAARETLGRLPADKISLLDEPLDSKTYCQLARQCDIGLLPYDRDRYYARCSGVLVELLSSGVPVVVPAGCWLADQLAEPNREYHLKLRESQAILGRVVALKPTQAAVPKGANHLLLMLRWPVGMQLCTGGYARAKITCWAASGQMIRCHETVVGPGMPDRQSTALVPLEPGTAEATIVWRNAYSALPLTFNDCELTFLRSEGDRPLPLGAVGLAAIDPEQTAQYLDDVIRHHAHYRRTALQFAPQWNEWHSPGRLITELLARTSTGAAALTNSRGGAVLKPHYPLQADSRVQRFPLGSQI